MSPVKSAQPAHSRKFSGDITDVYSVSNNPSKIVSSAIEDWIKAMPSVYVLKEWEKSISKSKDAMFLELYEYSPNWVKIIWDMLKADTIENHREFGEFVTRNLNNRIGTYEFDEKIIGAKRDISPEELRRVVEGERYFVYDPSP